MFIYLAFLQTHCMHCQGQEWDHGMDLETFFFFLAQCNKSTAKGDGESESIPMIEGERAVLCRCHRGGRHRHRSPSSGCLRPGRVGRWRSEMGGP
jgi:hypothetical protein